MSPPSNPVVTLQSFCTLRNDQAVAAFGKKSQDLDKDWLEKVPVAFVGMTAPSLLGT